ncbi:hypothetical protein LXL04_035264 [Taraxacum kok-saghyz]
MKEIQRYWQVTPSGPEQYEVYAVDLEETTCRCRAWQLTGIACVHGIAAILFLNGNPEDYVAVWFQTKVFSSSYRYTIKPVNGADMWANVDAHTIFPPRRRRLPGRPKVSRRKCPSEKEGRHTVTKKGVVPKCGNCHQPGHNKRRCPLLNPVNEAPDQGPVVEEEQQPDLVPVAQEEQQHEVPFTEYQAEEEVEADHEGNEEVHEEDHEGNHAVEEEETDHGVGKRNVGVSKRHHPSKRVTKLKLRRNVVTPDGSGGSNDNPCFTPIRESGLPTKIQNQNRNFESFLFVSRDLANDASQVPIQLPSTVAHTRPTPGAHRRPTPDSRYSLLPTHSRYFPLSLVATHSRAAMEHEHVMEDASVTTNDHVDVDVEVNDEDSDDSIEEIDPDSQGVESTSTRSFCH